MPSPRDDCLFCRLVARGRPRAPRPTGSSRFATSTRRRETHLLVLPERHVDTFRDVAAFPDDEAARMLRFVADTARRRRARGLPRARQRRRRAEVRRSSTCTGTCSGAATRSASPAIRGGREPDRAASRRSSRRRRLARDDDRRDALRLVLGEPPLGREGAPAPAVGRRGAAGAPARAQEARRGGRGVPGRRPRGAGRARRSTSSTCSRSSCPSRSPRRRLEEIVDDVIAEVGAT